jgi:MYXO-CTERM domain-containing protein
VPSAPLGLSQSFFLELSFAATSRGGEWATLHWRTGVANGPLDLTLLRGGASGEPATTTLASYPFQIPNPPPIVPGGVGLASDGIGYLAAWAEDQVIKLAPISPTGGVGTITTHAGWATSASLRLASNGAGYLIAWVDPSGSLRASRLDAGGAVADPTDIPVASAASRVLGLEPAGSDYLVTYESVTEAGIVVRAARIAADGTVRDPEGFDLGATAEIAVTAVRSDLWLMIQASHAEPDRTLLVGRFIGESLPSPPANPVPPPSPRLPPDGGALGNGGSSPAEAGTSTGGASGSGGAAPGGDAASAGGTSSVDAGTRRDRPSSEIVGGCGCTVAARKKDAGAVTAVLLLVGLAFSRRNQR